MPSARPREPVSAWSSSHTMFPRSSSTRIASSCSDRGGSRSIPPPWTFSLRTSSGPWSATPPASRRAEMLDLDHAQTASPTRGAGRRVSVPNVFRGTSSAVWVTLLCVGLVGLFSVLSPDQAFFSQQTFKNVLLSSAEIVLLCVAQAMLLGAGQIDISQGGMIILSSVVGGKVMVAVTGTGGEVAVAYPHLGPAIALAVIAA